MPAFKRKTAAKEEVKHYTEGPDIALLSIVASNYLRGYIPRRPSQIIQLLIPILHSHTKIRQFNLPKEIIATKQHILRFQIPVANIQRVQVINRK